MNIKKVEYDGFSARSIANQDMNKRAGIYEISIEVSTDIKFKHQRKQKN